MKLSDWARKRGTVRIVSKAERELLERISSAIREVGRDSIIAGYLFGSTVKPQGFKGDLDIGLLLEKRVLVEGIIEVQTRIYLRLKEILEREDIDVVILNRSSPLLRYAVIKEGILLYEGNRDRRIEFEVRTMLEHFDLSFMRRLFWEEIVKRVKDGRFAKSDY
jgi:predicted nucleotidyltransferase